MGKSCAIFIDRDDTLMVDVKYCDNPELVRLIPGAAEGLRLLNRAGFPIIIVTNQSGIGRGFFDAKALDSVHARLRDELRREGADFNSVYYCPHTPEDNCQCRKPKPGLLLKATSELNLDLSSSYMIGDRDLDLETGRAAGTQTILVSNGAQSDLAHDGRLADFVVGNLMEAARLIFLHSRIPVGTVGLRNRSRSSQN